MGVLPLKSGSYNAEQGRGGMPMDDILQVNERLRGLIWGAPMLILLLGTGLYFTAVTGVFQVRYCALWLRKTLFSCFTGAARRTSGGVSPFAAMCTALAATVGTGNIAGVATALTLGGPGAVFWLWVSAFVGMMTAFAENTLGMLYREKGSDGSWRGGAMLYLKNGLHSPLLAGGFALFCVLASFGIGNMSQCNSIAQGLSGSFGIPSGIVGAVTAVLLGAVLLGGLKRLSRVTETLVPFMALFYMGGAVVVLWVHRANLPQAFAMAFDARAGTGGVLGYGMTQAVRAGVSRGIFSNEAGLGSSVMVHAAADAREPCEQGMWAVFEVFFGTIVMCSVTAFVILTSGVYDVSRYALASGTPLLSQLTTGAQLTAEAFSTVFGRFGGGFVAVSLTLFAAAYLMGERVIPVYKAAFLLTAVAGCMMRLEPVWALSDTFNGLMALPNLAGVLALRRQVIAEWCRYKHDL